MPAMNFSTFLMQIADALRGEKGPELAYLLRPIEEHGKSLIKEFRNPTVRIPYDYFVSVKADLGKS